MGLFFKIGCFTTTDSEVRVHMKALAQAEAAGGDLGTHASRRALLENVAA